MPCKLCGAESGGAAPCPSCGFDSSLDYEQYPTLATIDTAPSLAAQRRHTNRPVTWQFDERSGTLIISGLGPIPDDLPKAWFISCKKIRSAVIEDGVTSIAPLAFRGCISLTSVTIPDSVTSIGSGAFSDCVQLTSVTIPDNVTSIGSEAFAWCTNLRRVFIPAGVKSIGNSAFSWCRGLTSVTLPDGVTNIGEKAFYYCSSLTSVAIPGSVTSIGSDAFTCSNLKTVHFGGSPADWEKLLAGSSHTELRTASILFSDPA